MTVANFFVSERQAICLTDTLVYSTDGQPIGLKGAKCHVLPSGRVAVTGRGNCAFHKMIERTLFASDNVDEAEGLLSLALAALPNSITPNEKTLESYVMGYSPALGRVRVLFGLRDFYNDTAEVKELAAGYHFAPEIGSGIVERLPRPATDEIMRRVSLAQAKLNIAGRWKMCIGGCMWATTVTSDGISQRVLGIYPDYRKHARLGVDPDGDVALQYLAVGDEAKRVTA